MREKERGKRKMTGRWQTEKGGQMGKRVEGKGRGTECGFKRRGEKKRETKT